MAPEPAVRKGLTAARLPVRRRAFGAPRRPACDPGRAGRRRFSLALLALVPVLLGLAACGGLPPPERAPGDLPVNQLELPPGFRIALWALVPGARSLALAPDDVTVYVGTRERDVVAVRDLDRDGSADQAVRLASGLETPNGVAVAPDGTLYIAEQHRITRLPPGGRQLERVLPRGVLPDSARHGRRYAAFGPDGRLYVAVGAPCNICDVSGLQGTIVRLGRDGHGLEVFAWGVRNSLGFDWQPLTGEMFFTDQGGDGLGDFVPPDELDRAPQPGLHFGYPYRYGRGTRYPGFEHVDPPQLARPPALAFPAHAAAAGIDFYRGRMFPPGYRYDAFVALHGSSNRTGPVGYEVVRIRFDGGGDPLGQEVFVSGWLDRAGRPWGRPVDLEELPDGSLLISDDHAGAIYRVTFDRSSEATFKSRRGRARSGRGRS